MAIRTINQFHKLSPIKKCPNSPHPQNTMAGPINLPFFHHSLLPLIHSTARPSNLCNLPPLYHSLPPFALSIAGPSSLCNLPPLYHSLLPPTNSTAGPSSL